MKRFEEKVKDIVGVRPFAGLTDFASSGEATVSGYYFTDATSSLMAKWLDTAARVADQSGSALALAGYRGVGKSHFLAVLGTILGTPELRSRIADPHVSAGMQTLMRRRYPVVYVRRGTKPTLFEEFFDGLAGEFGPDAFTPGDSAVPLLEAAARKAGDMPLIVIVDTAVDRMLRVARDDGELLGALGAKAKELNVLFCVALDDDIEGADGSNAAIAETFSIHFLDQDHLYKVVNQHVFPKKPNVEPVVNELYEFFRTVVPRFRWSPQRFAALYPLHPGIMEVAPYIRLFVHDFALLGFAAEAAERILGRPANSLIAFDEVFDKAESSLRKIDDLKDAFGAYDRLNAEVVSKIPVMQRLQAKLILKALLLLSLDGRGATVEEICASMLIYDDDGPDKVVEGVKGIIEKFSAAMPNEIAVRRFAGGDPHYAFRVSSKDDLNSALQESISELSPETAYATVRRLLHDRFPDFALGVQHAGAASDVMECTIHWRGSQRRGRIVWQHGEKQGDRQPADHLDWDVWIQFADDGEPSVSGGNKVVWRPERLKSEEIETLLCYYALQFDATLAARFGEHVRPTLHAHRVAAEKVVDRVMLEGGKLEINGFDFNFSEEARTSRTVTELLSVMVDPLFETRFPEHPVFDGVLGMAEVSRLVSDLYVSSRRGDSEVQDLAERFALPLGLVKLEGSKLTPAPMDDLEQIPAIPDVLRLIEAEKDGIVPLKAIYELLRKAPYGYAHESQHLMLAALVAERRLEFVTSRGDRINHRSLDLRIIWDDIVGVAAPREASTSAAMMNRWAGILSGGDPYTDLSGQAEQDRLLDAFRAWLAEWDAANVIERFELVSATRLNTREWANASRVKNTLGVVADELRGVLRGTSTIESCLSRISGTFADSEAELQKGLEAMRLLACYMDALEVRDKILAYLTSAELTSRPEIEAVRESLVIALEHAVAEPAEARNREVAYLWERFQREFADAYVLRHDEIMRSHDLQEKYTEIRRSDVWFEFVELSEIPLFRGAARYTARSLTARLDQLDCRFDLARALKKSSSCVCGFRLDESAKWKELPSELWGTVLRALESYRATLAHRRDLVIDALEQFSKDTKSADHAVAASNLTELLSAGVPIPRFSGAELQVLRAVLSRSFNDGKLYAAIGASEPDERAFAEEPTNDSASDVVVEDAVVVEI